MILPQPKSLLRAASILALLQYAAHSYLFLAAAPTHGPEEIAVIEAMQSHRFAFGGFQRSYWDFYCGYALIAILMGAIEIFALWLLANLAASAPHKLRPIISLFVAANLAHALLALKYFFLKPVIADGIVALCLVLAFLSAAPGRTERSVL